MAMRNARQGYAGRGPLGRIGAGTSSVPQAPAGPHAPAGEKREALPRVADPCVSRRGALRLSLAGAASLAGLCLTGCQGLPLPNLDDTPLAQAGELLGGLVPQSDPPALAYYQWPDGTYCCYVYDQAGHAVCGYRLDEYGEPGEVSVNELDAAGNVVKATTYECTGLDYEHNEYEQGDATYVTEFEFDQAGRILHEKGTNLKDESGYSYENSWEYDDAGRKTLATAQFSFDEDPGMKTRNAYERDAQGNVTRYTCEWDGDSVAIADVDYRYEGSQVASFTITSQSITADEVIEGTCSYEGGKLSRMELRTEDDLMAFAWDYDAAGQVSEVSLSLDGEEHVYFQAQYDEEGNLVSCLNAAGTEGLPAAGALDWLPGMDYASQPITQKGCTDLRSPVVTFALDEEPEAVRYVWGALSELQVLHDPLED